MKHSACLRFDNTRKNLKLNLSLVVLLVHEFKRLLSCKPEVKPAVPSFVVSSRYEDAF